MILKNNSMKFQVEIFESNSKIETIEAQTKEEALAKVRDSYEKGEILLTDDNSYIDVNFRIV